MNCKTAAQMREIDRVAIEERGIPSLLLMENAAKAVTNAVLQKVSANGTIVVLCGYGNNGGDGIACARLLHEKGCTVYPYLIGDIEKMSADAKAMYQKMRAVGLDFLPFSNELPDCDCIVDAIFGVGLTRPVEGVFQAAILAANQKRVFTVACDIPSGISADTGAVLGCSIRANQTITFTCLKQGITTEPAKSLSGNIQIADIGIPKDLYL